MIIRSRSRRSILAETKASAGEDPRPDTTIFRDALTSAKIKGVTGSGLIYNDLSRDKKTRRFKVADAVRTLSPAELNRVHAAMNKHFGSDRVLEVGLTRPKQLPWSHAWVGGNKLYVRLTAY